MYMYIPMIINTYVLFRNRVNPLLKTYVQRQTGHTLKGSNIQNLYIENYYFLSYINEQTTDRSTD